MKIEMKWYTTWAKAGDRARLYQWEGWVISPHPTIQGFPASTERSERAEHWAGKEIARLRASNFASWVNDVGRRIIADLLNYQSPRAFSVRGCDRAELEIDGVVVMKFHGDNRCRAFLTKAGYELPWELQVSLRRLDQAFEDAWAAYMKAVAN